MREAGTVRQNNVILDTEEVGLEGELVLPAGAEAVVVLAHGSGSSRHSPRS